MADILVIEDEAALRHNIVRILNAEGYRATGAANGREGIALAREHKPNLVISDVLMPEVDGFGVLSALREHDETAGIPFIFLTGLDDRQHFRRGMGLGADDYLNKPFRRDELVSAVEVRLARAAVSLRREAERLSERERQLQEMFRRELLGETHDRLAGIAAQARSGEVRRATVLFSDIRDFTTISERLSAQEVAELLNAYFQHVCDPIAAYGGHALRFIGDGVMAVFDAQVGDARPHARRALLAALGMTVAAQRFRNWLALRFGERGLPEFAIGIGVHEGEVMMCAVGAQGRREYTAIGDTVNLASRLEGKTRELGCSVIASRAALQAAGAGIEAGRSLTLWVKGRTAPVEAVEIAGMSAEPGVDDTARVRIAGEVGAALRENSEITARAVKAALAVTQAVPTLPQVKGYRMQRLLGRGGMSDVVLALRESDGAQVVLKLLDAKSHEDDDLFQRFIQEHALIADLHHRHVVRIHDQAFADDVAYIAMEYFAGGDLRREMDRGLTPHRALEVVAQVASGLAEIHRHGIVHRDIKPANLMLRADGSVVLADFGIAKHASRSLAATRHGEVLGTPFYLSPEQAAGAPATPQSDIYSLGVLAFEMLAGHRPYSGDSVEALLKLHAQAPVPKLPAALQRWQPLVDGLMAKDVRRRFTDAQQVLAWLAREARTEELLTVDVDLEVFE
jgi:class 3 adenylate cyclase/tRNA A-37 threonylcarbamoyl transferase component Bud32